MLCAGVVVVEKLMGAEAVGGVGVPALVPVFGEALLDNGLIGAAGGQAECDDGKKKAHTDEGMGRRYDGLRCGSHSGETPVPSVSIR